MEAKILTISEAIRLYTLIGDYLPNIKDVTSVHQYCSDIIQSLLDANMTSIYTDVVVLFTRENRKTVVEEGEAAAIKIFQDGMILNHIVSLKEALDTLWQTNKTTSQ